MYLWRLGSIALGLVITGSAVAQTAVSATTDHSQDHTLRAGTNGQFLLEGKPFQIRAGEMHYPRVPRADWRDRMRKLKAMGLNTLTTYVFWNLHEPSPGQYDFAGQNDLAEYLKEAQQEGLYVILRPGPYICAEWEFGGLPAWLLKDPSLEIRSRNPLYLAAVRRWFGTLGQVVHPLMLSQGGPIIAVQVENEYGAYGDDHAYMEDIKSMLQASGMGDGYLYTADGPSYFKGGALPELPVVVNFGTGDAEKAFAALKSLRPDGPMMSGEFWDGWFDHWGDVHQHRSDAAQEEDLKWMLDRGYSFNLYMAEGGTSFGWMNGANSDGHTYEPDTTSYDYDAPIDERGVLRPKYFAFRDLIMKATGIMPAQPPVPIPAMTYPISSTPESASLWANLPQALHADTPLSMEDVGQAYGYILYTTPLRGAAAGATLDLSVVHDYAEVYLDHQRIGTMDRRLGQHSMLLPAVPGSAELEVLVENTGRVNYTRAMLGERKGIIGHVMLGGTELRNWAIFSLPMLEPEKLHYQARPCSGPCFFRARLLTSSSQSGIHDTYLKTTTIPKGMVWMNGHVLGRAWEIGPQGALYVPGSWLHGDANEIDVFDLRSTGTLSLSTSDHPLFFEPPAQPASSR